MADRRVAMVEAAENEMCKEIRLMDSLTGGGYTSHHHNDGCATR
jgi:hypothetical protein